LDIKNALHILMLCLAVLFLAGQAAPKSKKQLMDEAIQLKVDEYIKTMEQKCETKVQKRAAEIVDSLLVKVAQVKTVDTFERPAKPSKPNRPTIRTAKDTTAVKPLFDQ